MRRENKLVIIGNGFDLAHGLKTSYKNFIDWYLCQCYSNYCVTHSYTDELIKMVRNYNYGSQLPIQDVESFEKILSFFDNTGVQTLGYPSMFFRKLMNSFKERKWVDIEREYFNMLKIIFSNPRIKEKEEELSKLNKQFNFLIMKLTEYIQIVNQDSNHIGKLDLAKYSVELPNLFKTPTQYYNNLYLNFNYTDILFAKGYIESGEINHIHGRASDLVVNPIIFGYGDETDPIYQSIEDSGENAYLEHIKSFGYFKTNNYRNLLQFINNAEYTVYILGHSCGLSDRVLLNYIFEHRNCNAIDIFYHVRDNNIDNFTEVTQEISRHFKPENKGLMRTRIRPKNPYNIIPQNN